MIERASKLLLFLLAAFLVLQASFSVSWPIAHDEAPLFYEAFLMQSEGRLPYRDFFDFQMPGSYMAYLVLGALTGFNDLRIRLLDLLILAGLLTITYSFMKGFGRIPAAAGALFFGLKYLQGGPSMALQRDYLLLLFIACAIWIFLHMELAVWSRTLIGVLVGCAAMIKPHAAIGLIPFLFFDATGQLQRQERALLTVAASNGGIPVRDGRAILKAGIPTLIGFLIPVLAVVLWLSLNSALFPFLDIAQNYWPLYTQINGQMEVNGGAARWGMIFDQIWRLAGNTIWIIPAWIGVYLVSPSHQRTAHLLAGFAICYGVYPALSGQFFPYHYIPFMYFIVLLAALCLTESKWRVGVFFLLVGVVSVNIRPSPSVVRQLDGKPVTTSTGRADEIERFLHKNLQPGDRVQPLDWTGGTLLAMLETRTSLATSYVFDFYFYHHVSDSYIQDLRTDFMNELQASPPRFIIEVTAIDKPWISGADTSRDFLELRAFLEQNYSVTMQRDDYLIYERQ